MPTIGSTLLQAYQCGVFGNPLWLPWWLRYKESACSAGDLGLIPGSGRSPGEGHGYPLQYSCLENPMDRGAWQATIHGIIKSQTRLSNISFLFFSFMVSLKLKVTLLFYKRNSLFPPFWGQIKFSSSKAREGLKSH